MSRRRDLFQAIVLSGAAITSAGTSAGCSCSNDSTVDAGNDAPRADAPATDAPMVIADAGIDARAMTDAPVDAPSVPDDVPGTSDDAGEDAFVAIL